jgi:hypothetical protein
MASFTPVVKDILKRHLCRYDRPGKGDHEIWYSPINNHKFSVDHKITSRGLAQTVLKQAGITERVP